MDYHCCIEPIEWICGWNTCAERDPFFPVFFACKALAAQPPRNSVARRELCWGPCPCSGICQLPHHGAMDPSPGRRMKRISEGLSGRGILLPASLPWRSAERRIEFMVAHPQSALIRGHRSHAAPALVIEQGAPGLPERNRTLLPHQGKLRSGVTFRILQGTPSWLMTCRP